MSQCACGCGRDVHHYQPGDPVWWYDQPRQGYGAFRPVKADFVKSNTKTVTIAVYLARGGTKEKRVSPASIKPRTTQYHRLELLCDM